MIIKEKFSKIFSLFIFLLLISGIFILFNYIPNEAKAQLPNGVLIGTITFYNNQSSQIPAYTPIYFTYNAISSNTPLTFNGIFDANGNVYYAYAMPSQYSGNYIIWVNLSYPINANSQLTLYLMYNSSWSGYLFNEALASQNNNWSGDNGNLVFPYYFNFFELTNAPAYWNGYGYTIVQNYGANVSATGSVNSFNLLQFTKPINYPNNYLYSNWCVDIYAKGLSNWGTPSGGSYGIYEEFGLFNTTATSQTSGVSTNPGIYILNNYGRSGTTLNIANATSSTYSSVYTSVPNNGSFMNTPFSWFDFGMLNNQAFVLINAYNDFAFNLSYLMGYNNSLIDIGFSNQTYAVNQLYYFGIYLFDTNTAFNQLFIVIYRNLPPNGIYPGYSIAPYTPYNVSFNFNILDSSVSTSPVPCGFQGNIYTNSSSYASVSFPNINTGSSNYLNFSISSSSLNTFYFNFNITNYGNIVNMNATDSKGTYFAQVVQAIVNANASVSYSLTYYQNGNTLLPEFNASITFTGYNVSITFILYNVYTYNFYDLPFNYQYGISIQSVLMQSSTGSIYNTINYNTPQFTLNSNATIWAYTDTQTLPYINFTIYKSGFFGLGGYYTSINIQGNNSISVSDHYPYNYYCSFFDPYTLTISYSGVSYTPSFNILFGTQSYYNTKQTFFWLWNDSYFPLNNPFLDLYYSYQSGYEMFYTSSSNIAITQTITDPNTGNFYLNSSITGSSISVSINIANGYNKTFSNVNYTSTYPNWKLSLSYSYYSLANVNNVSVNSQNISFILPAVSVNIYASYNGYIPYQNTYTMVSSNEIINITFNINAGTSQIIYFTYYNSTPLQNIPMSIQIYDLDNKTSWSLNTTLGTPYLIIAPVQFNASYNITIQNNYYNVYYTNVSYNILNAPNYIAYINFNGYANAYISLYCTNIYNLSFNFIYAIYSYQSVNISISNSTNTLYPNIIYTTYYGNANNVSSYIYLKPDTYTYLIKTLNSDLAYNQNTINLNSNTSIIVNAVYPVLFFNIDTNISLSNIPISIYYYDTQMVYPNTQTIYNQTLTSLYSLTIPANTIIYVNLTQINVNGTYYYPVLLYSNPNITINQNSTFGFNNGYLSLSFITYSNLTLYLTFTQVYFISLTFININSVYVNYSIYNGYIYNNQSILLNGSYFSIPFEQNVYYIFSFSPYNSSYKIIPQYISGYLTQNMNYTIIGIITPSVNTQYMNNTIPAPLGFNWIIPNFIIYGYTSDYLFALTFIAFLIGVAIYTGYKLRSDLIPILILVIGLFLLYVVNLLPLWVSILTIAGVFIFYYFFKRGENIL